MRDCWLIYIDRLAEFYSNLSLTWCEIISYHNLILLYDNHQYKESNLISNPPVLLLDHFLCNIICIDRIIPHKLYAKEVISDDSNGFDHSSDLFNFCTCTKVHVCGYNCWSNMQNMSSIEGLIPKFKVVKNLSVNAHGTNFSLSLT